MLATGDGEGRLPRALRWIVSAALGLALLAVVPPFLESLLACDRDGKRTLYQLSAPMTFLIGLGGFAGRLARARPVELLAIFSLVLLLAALVVRRRSLTEQSLPLLAGLTLLALSAALLLGPWLFPAFLAGIAAAVVLWRGRWMDLPAAPRLSPWLLFLPVALGAALRFYALNEIPGGFAEHAVVHHLNSAIPYKEKLIPLLRPGHALEAARMAGRILRDDHFGLMSILAAFGFEGLGVGFLSARLLSALAGTLTIAAAYFMGRALEDGRTGLLFAFLMAVSPWHITVSRYSDLEHVLCPLQLILALGLYGAAIRTSRVSYYALAAVALGFSWYVYAPNQVLPLIVALHLGATLTVRRGLSRRDWWNLGVFALLFAATASGPIRGLLGGHLSTTIEKGAPMSSVPFHDFPRDARMLVAATRQLFVRADDAWFSKPGGGLSLTEACLLLPGLLLYASGLRRPARRSTSALLLLAVPLSMIPGILAPDDSLRRFYPTMTLALFVAAAMLSRSVEAARRAGLPPRAVAGAGLAFLIAVAAVNADVYFNRSLIWTEDSAAFLTETAKRVKESFGKEFVYVCVPSRPEGDDYSKYARFATYHEQLELARQGAGPEDRYRVIVPGELPWILADPRSIHGRTRFLAEESVVRRTLSGVDVQGAICGEDPDAVEEVYRDRHGRIVLRSWLIRRGHGSGPSDEPVLK